MNARTFEQSAANAAQQDSDVYTRALYGQFARHVPAWFWVQDALATRQSSRALRGLSPGRHIHSATARR